jgi:hypothetical protein
MFTKDDVSAISQRLWFLPMNDWCDVLAFFGLSWFLLLVSDFGYYIEYIKS